MLTQRTVRVMKQQYEYKVNPVPKSISKSKSSDDNHNHFAKTMESQLGWSRKILRNDSLGIGRIRIYTGGYIRLDCISGSPAGYIIYLVRITCYPAGYIRLDCIAGYPAGYTFDLARISGYSAGYIRRITGITSYLDGYIDRAV